MQVAAIAEGTVIDHIPTQKTFQVISLLGLEDVGSAVTIGINLPSRLMGRKSIIKIADRHFSDEEVSRLAIVARELTLCTIKDYRIAEKRRVTPPEEIRGIIRCSNPKCITNNEPMLTHFAIAADTCTCRYCNTEQSLNDAKLI